MSYRLAADIGGTFTDIVLVDDTTGTYRKTKVLTTPEALEKGLLKGLDEIVGGDYSEVTSIVHGTTSGLNALIERKGAHCALVTTKGFRDVYEIARVNRPEIYNIQYHRPEPLIPRKDIFEVDERVLMDGTVEKAVVKETMAPVIEKLKGSYEAVAVCFLNSYVNPENEAAACEILKNELGHDVIVTASHEIAHESREYERVSTTVLNAYIAPSTRRHVSALSGELEKRGFKGALYMMQSNGGVIRAEAAATRAVKTIMSGPVGGAIGASVMNRDNIISFDIGGTSFDVSVVLDSKIETTVESVVEGFPALTPTINIVSIGAGGGSLAWSEAGGMRVGPQSAGAVPGPVCYGRGGTQPAITDANLVLGHMAPRYFLGGRMRIEEEKTWEALRQYGEQFQMDAVTAADGICMIANHKMANAIREITVNRGIDPRDFSILAFGGAGPMHAAQIAGELDIEEVIVPANPGVFSAWGMLQADIRHDVAHTKVGLLDALTEEDYEKEFGLLYRQLTKALVEEQIAPEEGKYLRTLDMRYLGQENTIPVDMDAGEFSRESVEKQFSDTYERLYGHHSPDDKIEIVNYRLTVMVPMKRIPVTGKEGEKEAEVLTEIKGYFDGQEVQMKVYDREQLHVGSEVLGPSIVIELTSTTVIPPEWKMAVDEHDNMILTRQKKRGRCDE